eukprot:TRINITY_DN1685_c2_g2_i1.p1 TRINITY_DN1685_c2_g2~~TRINITY_DN1685_c2_g2_i1.p1  ORF type:complete len:239 (+),score=17.14 TRINITY_DN1685_c2_g2_i1:124-840(+)
MIKQWMKVKNQLYSILVRPYCQIPVMTDVVEVKKQMRINIKTKLKQLSIEQMQGQSEAIGRSVLSSNWWKNADRVGLYIQCERLREVDTSLIVQDALEKDMKVYIPRVDGQQSDMSFLHLDRMESLESVPPFGILEPTNTYPDGTARQNVFDDEGSLQVLLMPGLGFDKNGRRLGRGGGYYDKFVTTYLALLQQRNQPQPLLVGLCYDVQLQEDIPISDHDHPVHMIIAPDGIHKIHD